MKFDSRKILNYIKYDTLNIIDFYEDIFISFKPDI